MKNYVKRIGSLAIIAVIGFVTAACVEYEEKHGDDFSLKYLPGTWKASEKNGGSEITATVVFSAVKNGEITMKITEHKVTHVGGTRIGHTTGYYLIDKVFGYEHHYEGGGSPNGIIKDSDVWERTYTQAEIKTLQWDLRTLGKESSLIIQYLIPAGACNCENCEHNFTYNINYYNGCCYDKYCSSKPQGNLAALIDLEHGLTFKKQ